MKKQQDDGASKWFFIIWNETNSLLSNMKLAKMMAI